MKDILTKYTARALNEFDEKTINSVGIVARCPLSSDYTIEDSLKIVGSHLKNGSNEEFAKQSCWVSHSKNLCKVIGKYSFSSSTVLHARSNIAIIKDCNKSIYSQNVAITSFEQLKKATIDDVPVLNLDLSTKESVQKLFNYGLLINCNGDKYFGINCIPLNYAVCSSELLALNTINKDSIKYILNALMSDIVYAIANCNIDKSNDDIIDEVVNHKNDILNCLDTMNPLLKNFYESTYVAKKEIYNIVEECDLNKYDPLAIEAYIIELKRIFLKMILEKVFNLKNVDVNLLEDRHHLATIGIPNQQTKINLFNQTVDLKQFEYRNMCTRVSGIESDIIAMIKYRDISWIARENQIFTYNSKMKRLYLMDSNNLYKCPNRLKR